MMNISCSAHCTMSFIYICMCLYMCVWKLIKCQWSRRMIRSDWRWAHKRSIIPPSDRRRYRPTRWSKSTKDEQIQRDTIGQSVMAYFDDIFIRKERRSRAKCFLPHSHLILIFSQTIQTGNRAIHVEFYICMIEKLRDIFIPQMYFYFRKSKKLNLFLQLRKCEKSRSS